MKVSAGKVCALIGSTIFLMMVIGCKTMKKEKFDWLASESGPKNYPMEIVSGKFYSTAGKGGASVPAGRTIYDGWGESVSMHVVGEMVKGLPNKLEITFFSYAEDKFYQGEFDLPYEKILDLFQQGFYSVSSKEQITFDELVVGVAPGGSVAVWVTGKHISKQVFFGQAKEANVPWETILDNPEFTRKETIEDTLHDAVETAELDLIRSNGVPINRWKEYQKRYYWLPNFVVENRQPKMVRHIEYVNGEYEYMFLPLSAALKAEKRAVPTFFNFPWQSPDGKFLTFRFILDEKEVRQTFDKLEEKYTVTEADPIKLTVYIFENKGNRQYGIAAQHGDKEETEIILNKVKIKMFLAVDPDDPDEYYVEK